VYVGRLAYDKSVDVLLAAFASALTDGGMGGRAALYLVGTGELLPLVREYEEAHPGGVHYAGHAPHHQVACVLREADAYVSAAPNET
jgi:glycosyltransferase involved in cell wall biosynthesis